MVKNIKKKKIKDEVTISTDISKPLYKAFVSYSEESGIKKKKIISMALSKLLLERGVEVWNS